jgi:hypothetical protein
MKKIFTRINIKFFLILLVGISCSNEEPEQEDDNIIRNLQGTVIGNTTCNTKNNGLAYIIQIDDFTTYEFIITGSLPDELKIEQLRITFDMRQSFEEFTFCTADLPPEQFYVLTNISSIEN